MRSRPPDYIYYQGYFLFVAGLIGLGFGVVHLEWQPFALSLVCFPASLAFFRFLAWWRHSYDDWNPDDLDTESGAFALWVDARSTQTWVWLTRTIRRNR